MPKFKYKWQGEKHGHDDQRIIIKSNLNNKTLRTMPNGSGDLHCSGGHGGFAWYKVKWEDGKTKIRFQNCSTQQYMRIYDKGKKQDNKGGLGPYTLHQLVSHGNGVYQIKGLEEKKFYCVKPNGDVDATDNIKAEGTFFTIWALKPPQGGDGAAKYDDIKEAAHDSSSDSDDSPPPPAKPQAQPQVQVQYVPQPQAQVQAQAQVQVKPQAPPQQAQVHVQYVPQAQPQPQPAKPQAPPQQAQPQPQPAKPQAPPQQAQPQVQPKPQPPPQQAPQQAQVQAQYVAPKAAHAADDEDKEADAKQPQIPEKQRHPQPLPDAKGTIKPNPKFDPVAAAKILRESMKGMGTDEKKIIRVTCTHNREQLLKIAETFRKEYKRDLLDDLRSELGGKLEKILVPLYLPPGAFDAQLMKEAMDGIGYNTDKMVEVLCTRTNEELKAMAAQWKDKEPLQERVADETKNLFGANSLQTLMLAILRADRPPNGPVDQAAAERDAQMLAKKMAKSSKRGKKRMVEVFSTRSWTQIAAISKKYENASKEYTMRAAIEEAFGDSDTGKALMAIEEFSVQPYDFWAKKLHAALKGMGSDEETLIRVLVSRAEVDLDNVRTIFGQRYGDGKTLIKWMEGDVGGDFGLALVGLLGGEV